LNSEPLGGTLNVALTQSVSDAGKPLNVTWPDESVVLVVITPVGVLPPAMPVESVTTSPAAGVPVGVSKSTVVDAGFVCGVDDVVLPWHAPSRSVVRHRTETPILFTASASLAARRRLQGARSVMRLTGGAASIRL